MMLSLLMMAGVRNLQPLTVFMCLLQVAGVIQKYGSQLARDPRSKLVAGDGRVPSLRQIAAQAASGVICTKDSFLRAAAAAMTAATAGAEAQLG